MTTRLYHPHSQFSDDEIEAHKADYASHYPAELIQALHYHLPMPLETLVHEQEGIRALEWEKSNAVTTLASCGVERAALASHEDGRLLSVPATEGELRANQSRMDAARALIATTDQRLTKATTIAKAKARASIRPVEAQMVAIEALFDEREAEVSRLIAEPRNLLRDARRMPDLELVRVIALLTLPSEHDLADIDPRTVGLQSTADRLADRVSDIDSRLERMDSRYRGWLASNRVDVPGGEDDANGGHNMADMVTALRHESSTAHESLRDAEASKDSHRATVMQLAIETNRTRSALRSDLIGVLESRFKHRLGMMRDPAVRPSVARAPGCYRTNDLREQLAVWESVIAVDRTATGAQMYARGELGRVSDNLAALLMSPDAANPAAFNETLLSSSAARQRTLTLLEPHMDAIQAHTDHLYALEGFRPDVPTSHSVSEQSLGA